METQTNLPTPTQSEANTFIAGVDNSGVRGSISFTQDWCVLTHNRHIVSFGVQVKAPITERGMQKPRLFFTVDVSLAAETYSPPLADGMGGSQKGEFHCCGYGVQYRHTKISTIDEECYRCHRIALTELPFRSKNYRDRLSSHICFTLKIKDSRAGLTLSRYDHPINSPTFVVSRFRSTLPSVEGLAVEGRILERRLMPSIPALQHGRPEM